MRRSDPLWDLDGPEFDKKDEIGPGMADINHPEHGPGSPSYKHTTEIIKNQCEMLAMLIKGMRQ